MSKKGRRARLRRRGSVAPSQEAMEQVTSSEVDASPSAPPPSPETVEAVPPARDPFAEETPSPVAQVSTPSNRPPQPETPLAFSAQEPLPLPSLEDSSFPPVDLDSRFFDATPDSEETHERDPRMVLKLGPEAARRRAQFQKYVKIAVVAASVLCLAAVVKGAVTRNHDEPTAHRTTVAVVAGEGPRNNNGIVAPPPAPQTVQTPPAQAPAPAEQAAAPADPPATAPAATDTAAAAPTPAPTEQAAPTAAAPPAEAASATDQAAAAPTSTDSTEAPTPDPKEAAKAKHASQAALERGKLGDAIESGERSVALDPTDAEAWLILGAAYQEKGDQKNARRSFKSCLEQSKRGPKWECAQMPH
jgi:pyruvate dehydrogenase E2 component (dihydrolipoyllysine-residue acetyltransferase)